MRSKIYTYKNIHKIATGLQKNEEICDFNSQDISGPATKRFAKQTH